MQNSELLNAEEIEQKLTRMAYEIAERHYNEKNIVFIGIEDNGAAVSNRLFELVSQIVTIPCEKSSIQLSKENPIGSVQLSNPLSLKNKCVVLIDDVFNSGQTLMHAASFLVSQEIHRLTTAVLVERKHRRFPIKADFVGLKLSTTLKEHVTVSMDGKNSSVTIR
jgi:pyrimidine operon attenuation protein/uracil phosphoribosyltransferase